MVRDRTAAPVASRYSSSDVDAHPSPALRRGLTAVLVLTAALGCGDPQSTLTGPAAATSSAAAAVPVGALTPYLLDAPEGAVSHANGINISGTVVGEFQESGGSASRAFAWSRQHGFVTLESVPGATSVAAGAVNSAGDIIGISFSAAQGFGGVLWTKDGEVIDFGSSFLPSDIDDRRQIAGTLTTSEGRQHPAIWTNGQVTDIGLPDGMVDGNAIALNRFGDVIATVFPSVIGEDRHVAVWQPVSGWQIVSPASDAEAADIDKRGDLLGTNADVPTRPRATLWPGGGDAIDLGSLSGASGSSIGRGMNNFTVVVGETTTLSGVNAAFRWTDADGMAALPTVDGLAASASDISDRGDIVGQIVEGTGAHAVIWTARPMPAQVAEASVKAAAALRRAPASAIARSEAEHTSAPTLACTARPYGWLSLPAASASGASAGARPRAVCR